MTTVTLWHNLAPGPGARAVTLLFGYDDDDLLTPVATYTVDEPVSPEDVHAVAEEAFDLFTLGDDPRPATPDPRTVNYRACGHRPLSVGDVVQVGSVWLALEPVGFRVLSTPPGRLRTDPPPPTPHAGPRPGPGPSGGEDGRAT